ncbi:MAG TPA: hypothetical protein VL966_06965 [Alphaproteobacteria bacterium]|nr:hypothetical protein [Alphaproteobacteria bacterium]
MPTQSSNPAPLARLADLEARYDGPIPQRELDALRHGSALAADVAEIRAEIACFRELAARSRRSGKAWRARGNDQLATCALMDCRVYLGGWRARRRRLTALERAQRLDIAYDRTRSAIDGLLAPLAGVRSGDRR